MGRSTFFMKQLFSFIHFTYDKYSRIGLISALLTILSFSIFFNWKMGLLISCLFFVLSFLRLTPTNSKQQTLIHIISIFAVVFATAYCSQMLIGHSTLWHLPNLNIIAELFCILSITLILYIFTQKLKRSLFLSSFLVMLFSIADFYVYMFRGTEIQPIDFFSVKTAMNVASQYTFFTTEKYFYYGLVTWFAVLYFLFLIPINESKHKNIRLKCIPSLLVSLCLWLGICNSIKPTYWNANGTQYYGFLVNFTSQVIDLLHDKTPENYSLETVQLLENEYIETSTSQKSPNIIIIMNESFADFRTLGENFTTSQEIMPFYDSLDENTVKGNVLTSVFGGGTANAEYEMLSGNSIGFISSEAIVYQVYLKNQSYSIASYLDSLGYTTTATHPYLASGWQRTKVYPLLGFESYSFIESYPQENLIREYVSDQEMYEYIVKEFENKDENPLFLFGITMQNHGGYSYDGENYTPSVELEGYSTDYPLAEQYLGLIQESDKALEYLISYFETIEEDTIILFFGDHLPNVEQAFYEEIHGSSFETLDEQQLCYTTPFFIWANYDIEEEYVELTSLNYLTNYLYQAAGIALPSYNQFLCDVQSVIPAMNSKGYYSLTENKFLSYDEASGLEAQMLAYYEILQYNSLYDIENKSNIFFPTE